MRAAYEPGGIRAEERYAELLDVAGRLHSEQVRREGLESRFEEAREAVRANEKSRADYARSVEELQQQLGSRESVLSEFEASVVALRGQLEDREGNLREFERSVENFQGALAERDAYAAELRRAFEELTRDQAARCRRRCRPWSLSGSISWKRRRATKSP